MKYVVLLALVAGKWALFSSLSLSLSFFCFLLLDGEGVVGGGDG